MQKNSRIFKIKISNLPKNNRIVNKDVRWSKSTVESSNKRRITKLNNLKMNQPIKLKLRRHPFKRKKSTQ